VGALAIATLVPLSGDTGAAAPAKSLLPVVAVSAGYNHGLALMNNRTVQSWGDDSEGELGYSTTGGPYCGGTCNAVPLAVPNLTGVTAVSAGYESNLALLTNGTVKAWGDNNTGQLGDGKVGGPNCSRICSRTPVLVKGLTNVIAISAGFGYDAALLSNGTVKTWGNNQVGELGDGKTTGNACGGKCSDVPVKVLGLTGVIAISASGSSSDGEGEVLALLANGTIDAWGSNNNGQLGDGSFGGPNCAGNCSDVPVAVSGLTGVTHISAGGDYAMASTSSLIGYAWGAGNSGNLGDGFSSPHSTDLPGTICNQVAVAFPCSPVAGNQLLEVENVSASAEDSMGQQFEGNVTTWGALVIPSFGNVTSSPLPVNQSQYPSPNEVTAIAPGGQLWYMVLDNGTVQTWGAMNNGQLGNGTDSSGSFDESPSTLTFL
jgi:alpha-tubulin suppressor-like RCC1 family protein